MLLRIGIRIILCAPVEIHLEFQLLLVQYYSYQVCPVITITLQGISNFYRRSLHTRTMVSKNLDRSAKKCGNENKRPRAMLVVDSPLVFFSLSTFCRRLLMQTSIRQSRSIPVLTHKNPQALTFLQNISLR
jgi:hypothetical protein